MPVPEVESFFEPFTETWSHLLIAPEGCCAILDPVLDYDYRSGRTGTASAGRIAARVRERGLTVEWILETHVHADHLSAADWLGRSKRQLAVEERRGNAAQVATPACLLIGTRQGNLDAFWQAFATSIGGGRAIEAGVDLTVAPPTFDDFVKRFLAAPVKARGLAVKPR